MSYERDLDHALEVLAVTIGGIMEEESALAASPPVMPGGYPALAKRFGEAAAEIAALARTMTVLCERFR